MKKLMIAALMMLSTSAVFAGDSDALKAILKAKTYSEAASLVKSSVNSLATPAEKAKAYNYLVDLAMKKVAREQATMQANQLVAQLKTGKVQPYDTLGYYKGIYDAIANAIECDKYDNMPDVKGKVKPKFHQANQNKLYALRTELINAGQNYGEGNKQEAFNNFALYVESAKSNLFKEIAVAKAPDQYLGEVARVAAVYAFQNKDMDKANKYVDVALADTSSYKQALDLKIYLASQSLKTKSDSIQFANTLQGLYDKDPKNDMVFSQLAAVYQAVGKTAESAKLISDRLSADPNNYAALALKAQNAMNSATTDPTKYDEAIENFKKAIAIKPKDDALVYTYLAFCINAKAAACQKAAEQKAMMTESVGYLETARDLDPDRQRANWAYPLYQCYYTLYGANDSRTKEMEALVK